MNKINYVLIMLFMYMYSPVIYGQTKAQAIQTFKEITGQDVRGKSNEEIRKIFYDFTKKNTEQLKIARDKPTPESKRINEQWEALKEALSTLQDTSAEKPSAKPSSKPATKPAASKEEEEEEDDDDELNEGYSAGLIKTGESISNVSLSNFVKKIGEVISKSLCKDRAFTITPNIGLDGKRAPGFILLTHER